MKKKLKQFERRLIKRKNIIFNRSHPMAISWEVEETGSKKGTYISGDFLIQHIGCEGCLSLYAYKDAGMSELNRLIMELEAFRHTIMKNRR